MHVSLYSKTTMCVSTPNMFATISMPRGSIRLIANLAFNLPPVCHSNPNLRNVEALHGEPQIRFWKLAVNTSDHVLRNVSQSPRDFFNLIGLARPPEEADLSSTLEDAPVTKLLLHVTRDKLRTHAMFPEVAANGWHV